MNTRFILFFLFFLIAWLVFPSKIQADFSFFTRILNNSIQTKDWTPPKTTLFVKKFDTFEPLQETIANGKFEDELIGWDTAGDISICEKNMACIAHQDSSSFRSDNALSQLIVNSTKTLSFEYLLETEETLEGFDDPAFEVLVNNQPVFQKTSKEIRESDAAWQSAWIDLSVHTNSSIRITFLAGNSGDSFLQSTAKIRNITTTIPLSNSSTLFKVEVDDHQPSITYLQYNDELFEPESIFSLNTQLINNLLQYWSVDSYENKENSHSVDIIVDTVPPESVQHFQALKKENGQYLLTFVQPVDERGIQAFDIRYSKESSMQEQFATLLSIIITPESIHAPTNSEDPEYIFVQGLEENQEYFFYIQSKDRAGNLSDIGESI